MGVEVRRRLGDKVEAPAKAAPPVRDDRREDEAELVETTDDRRLAGRSE